MGRPIKKIYIGEHGAGNVGGESLASVTLGGVNNSTGYSDGDALTIGAPDVAGGVQAVGEVTVAAADEVGALVEGTTTFTLAGTGVDNGAATYTGITQKSTTGSGASAVFTIDAAGGQTDYSDITVTITTPGAGYDVADDIVIDGADIGGVTGTNDLTLTVATSVGVGEISGTSVTVAGSGYTSAPTVSAATGTQGTLTMTGVLTTGGAAVINCTAFVTGGSNLPGDIKAQKGDSTYRVTTADGTEECTLVNDTPAAGGEMAIIATDSDSGTYYVTKLYNRTVRLDPTNGTGAQFTAGDKVPWADTAVENVSVKITS